MFSVLLVGAVIFDYCRITFQLSEKNRMCTEELKKIEEKYLQSVENLHLIVPEIQSYRTATTPEIRLELFNEIALKTQQKFAERSSTNDSGARGIEYLLLGHLNRHRMLTKECYNK
jgi:hypothetical protein